MKKLIATITLIVSLTSCSFKIETGYHGLTGRDDRTQTQLIVERDSRKVKYQIESNDSLVERNDNDNDNEKDKYDW